MHLTRQQIVSVSRGWVGTPYHWQGRKKQVGCDCAGLLIGVWRELYHEQLDISQWHGLCASQAEISAQLIAELNKHLKPQAKQDKQPGDVLLFRWRINDPPTHVGILTSPTHFIHSSEKTAVIESFYHPFWQKRMVAVFSFPHIQP